MKIKICGFTNANNARESAMLGIDAIGLVFYEKSPRYVSIEQAQAIIQNLPPFINRIGLFVNQNQSFIENILTNVVLDTLQFHGNESANECEKYKLPYIKAIAMTNDINLKIKQEEYCNSNGLLLDTPSKYFGGTGKIFDWSIIKKIKKPIILAGGLNSNNIADAIKQVNPYGVDISSSVESSKGIKDINKIKQFLKNIHDI